MSIGEISLNIGIIGGGAVGLLFGYYLAKENTVTIYTKTEEQARVLERDGVKLEVNNRTSSRTVGARKLETINLNHDILFIAVKQYDIPFVLSKITPLAQISTIVFLQNGMGHLKLMSSLDIMDVIIGIVEHGVLKKSENHIVHTGIGITKLSSFRGSVDSVFSIFNGENALFFPAQLEEDWLENMTSKLVINSVINPLTALYKIENGELLRNNYYFETMRILFNEITSVLPIKNEQALWDKILSICKSTEKNRSSMLRDIELGKMTEIESILGYVLEQGTIGGRVLSVTSFVYLSIKGLESKGGN